MSFSYQSSLLTCLIFSYLLMLTLTSVHTYTICVCACSRCLFSRIVIPPDIKYIVRLNRSNTKIGWDGIFFFLRIWMNALYVTDWYIAVLNFFFVGSRKQVVTSTMSNFSKYSENNFTMHLFIVIDSNMADAEIVWSSKCCT